MYDTRPPPVWTPQRADRGTSSQSVEGLRVVLCCIPGRLKAMGHGVHEDAEVVNYGDCGGAEE
ncbi:hypothetical protein [Micromonospora sp. NPDC092111]|uniref:hypothetical protein n=1 Tax=Micromonospora sp. NPDC092111 TaxID=3364289 RepID=UPI0037FA5516